MKVSKTHRTLVVTFLTTSFFSSLSWGQSVKEKDWVLTETSSSADPMGVCSLSTSGKIKDSVIYFEIVRRKGVSLPTEVFVRQVGTTNLEITAVDAHMEGSDKDRYAMPPISNQNGVKTFWMLPRKTSTIIDAINRGDAPRATVANNPREKVNFSSKGFAKLFLEFQRKCGVAGQPINNSEFEASFLMNVQKPINPLGIQMANAQTLRNLFNKSYGLFYQLRANQQQINQLQAQYSVQLEESSRLNTQISTLQSVTLPGLRKSLADSQVNQVNAEASLASTTASIPGLRNQLEIAEVRLSKANEVIAPHWPEFNRLDDILDQALSELRRAEEQLSQVRAAIVSTESQIRNLNSELLNLDSQMSSLRFELNSALSRLDQAVRRLQNFDLRLEIARRIQNDFQLRNLKQEADSAARQAEMLTPEISRLDGALAVLRSELSMCQLDSTKDCSSLAAEVSAGEIKLRSLRMQQQDLISQVQDIKERMRFRENSLTRDVEREYSVLVEEERRAQNEVERVRDQLQRAERRREAILNFDLPDAERRVRALRDQKVLSESSVARANAAVRRADTDLATFRARVGWDSKKAELDAAQNLRDQSARALNAAINRKAELERAIIRLKQEQIDLAAAIVARTDELAKAQARLVVVTKSLEPYVAAKARLDGIKASLSSELAANQRQFEGILP